MNRRKLLGSGIGAAIFGPSAAKEAAASLAQVAVENPSPPTGWNFYPAVAKPTQSEIKQLISGPDALKALRLSPFWGEYESEVYQRNWDIQRLDNDIDNKRSFSLAAKITYQRQRNVAAIIHMTESTNDYESRWDVVRRFYDKYIGNK